MVEKPVVVILNGDVSFDLTEAHHGTKELQPLPRPGPELGFAQFDPGKQVNLIKLEKLQVEIKYHEHGPADVTIFYSPNARPEPKNDAWRTLDAKGIELTIEFRDDNKLLDAFHRTIDIACRDYGTGVEKWTEKSSKLIHAKKVVFVAPLDASGGTQVSRC